MYVIIYDKCFAGKCTQFLPPPEGSGSPWCFTMRRLVKRLTEDERLLAALVVSNIQIEDFVDLVRSVGKQK